MKANDERLAWESEYKRAGIPSSFRKDPTKPVVEFITWVKQKHGLSAGVAADIGCGRGRNSFYLASQGFSVTGLELLDINVREVNAEAALHGLPVKAFAQDVADKWPIPAGSLDMAIDIFCYKHIVSKERQASYRKELWQALKADGFYFISLASESDGFYGPLLSKAQNKAEKVVLDPYSNIYSCLYSMEDLCQEFSDFFHVLDIKESSSTSPMHGKEYPRQVINAIFKKRC